MVQCLNSMFGTYWFHLAGFGSKEGSFGVFCLVLLEEWSPRERSSTGLASASPHGCFTPDQIETLSGICLCLGQTSLCPFCSGSSLPHWPWTMSVSPCLFISVSDSGRKLQESQESALRRERPLPAMRDPSPALPCGFTEQGGFHPPAPSQGDRFLSECALKEMNCYQ